MLSFLDGLSPEDAARFFLLRRSGVPLDTVSTLVKPMLPIPLSDDAMHGVVVAVTGAAKALAVQLAEAARDVAAGAAVSDSHMVSRLVVHRLTCSSSHARFLAPGRGLQEIGCPGCAPRHPS